MSDLPEPSGPPRQREPFTPSWLRYMGSAVLLLFVLVGFAKSLPRTSLISPENQQAFMTADEIADFVLYVAVGIAASGFLVGLWALLLVLRDLHASFTRLEKFQYELKETAEARRAEVDHLAALGRAIANDANGDGNPSSQIPWREVIGVLEDLRDNSLLSEEERQLKKKLVADEEIRAASAKIRSLTPLGDFAAARDMAEALARKYPNDPRAARLVEQVEQSREKHEVEDVRAVTTQVNDLIVISAWGRARELAQQLQQRHPDSIEARQLLVQLETRYHDFQREQRGRMANEVQRFVTRKKWEEALAAARMFIERFPGSDECEALKMQLPTLIVNAEIDRRQKLEAKIMSLVREGRYIEALDMARGVIRDYPDSPQAEALREQIDRLEELALNPNAPPAAKMRAE